MKAVQGHAERTELNLFLRIGKFLAEVTNYALDVLYY